MPSMFPRRFAWSVRSAEIRRLGICWVLLWLGVGFVRAEEPLASRIDALVVARMQGAASPRTNDHAFLRRIYLDLAGRIPTPDEVRAFLADTAPDKRLQAIQRLLASPDYSRRMADAMHVMLLERQGESPEWQHYLQGAFATNKPWDQMVREMIWSDPADEATRGAAFFFTKRLENYGQNPVDYPAMVRDVGRLFLGIDVQCAQCHDHLFVDQYKQDYYQGLAAYLNQTFIRRDVTFPALGENPLRKKLEFSSVFVKEPRAIGPKLPGGDEVAIPELAAADEYLTPPDKKTNNPGVLKFSPLRLLSEQLPRKENPAFSRNAVNRVWWLLMGRGLVHPLDLHHADNPPTHPELLDLLAHEFESQQFDIQWLVRQLVQTEVYQRSTALPDGVTADGVPLASYRVAFERPLSSEQLVNALLQATGMQTIAAKQPTDLAKLRERFAKALANPPKEPETEFSPSVKAALFLANDEVVLRWFQPQDGNLVARLVAMSDADALLDELFLTMLTRTPESDERQELKEYLARHPGDRPTAIGRLAWALATSTEFVMNH